MEILLGFIFAIFSFIFVFNVVLYGGLIYLTYRGVKYFKNRRPWLAGLFLIMPVIPLAFTLWYEAKLADEAESRLAAIASLPRATLSRDQDIQSLTVIANLVSGRGLEYRLASLISTGALEHVATAQGTPSNVVQVFRAEISELCVESNRRLGIGFDVRSAAIAKNAFRICPAPDPDVDAFEAPIWLYRDNVTPNGNRDCPHASGEALELRMSQGSGGLLIDFQEVRQFRALENHLVMPSLAEPFWVRCHHGPYDPADGQRVNPFTFVTRALGLENLDDFPRLATVTDALEALKIMNEGNPDRSTEAITLLLGQWPSTPEISQYIRSSIRNEHVVKRALNTMFSGNVDSRLVPHLRSHASDFKAICPKTVSRASFCNRWTELSEY